MDLCCFRTHRKTNTVFTGQKTVREKQRVVSFWNKMFLCSLFSGSGHEKCSHLWSLHVTLLTALVYLETMRMSHVPVCLLTKQIDLHAFISEIRWSICTNVATLWDKIKMSSGACCCWPAHSLFLYLFSLCLFLFLSSCMLLQVLQP